MGEIAEMMLDGTLCEGCGVFLSAEPKGFPGYCSAQCAHDRGATRAGAAVQARGQGRAARQLKHIEHQVHQKKANCPVCNRRVKQIGMADHMRDAHQQAAA